MALPLLLKLGAAGLGFWALSKGKSGTSSGPSSPSSPGAVAPSSSMPVAQRMAIVLATGDAAAIRFEAGRLRQEGYPSQAAELEREATRLDAERAAAQGGGVLAPSPVVAPLPAGAVKSPGVPQPATYTPPPPSKPAPPVQAPPVVVQTPTGPIAVPQPAIPAVVIQTPVGPVTIPSLPIPAVPAPPPGPPITVQTQSGPVVVSAPVPLPVLADKELLSQTKPGQTYSEKTKLWQGWLASIGLMKPTDVIGKFGPVTTTATKNFQLLANAWLTLQQKPLLKVDGIVGPQTLAVAALAHPPIGTGATASYFGSLMGAWEQQPAPLPASPLPGIIPPMAPKAIEPRMSLASRLAHNIATTSKGEEDRALVQLFQMQEGLKPSGMYNASTAACLAQRYGIVPAKPRYWTETSTRKSKRNYSQLMRELGAKDAQRKEEWEQAGANL
jgi:hypothetical protein